MPQHRIAEPGPLLTEAGALREAGYATSLLLDYRRDAVRAGRLRLKEWDYYLVMNDRHALALTIADNGYMGLVSASLLDFTKPWQQTTSRMTLMPLGRTNLSPSSARGSVAVQGKDYAMSFANEDGVRTLKVRMDRFAEGKPLHGEVRLTGEPADSMVIATPFAARPRAFYYNQKINCMRAEGEVRFDGRTYAFDPTGAFGTLDWGRGVWTYENTWYWASANGLIGGVPFGMNLGYGFGDTSAASENMLFYDGRAHKLDQVDFGLPGKDGRDDYLAPWRFRSNDGRLTLDFVPILDRAARTAAGPLLSDQHQVFGRFAGVVVLDDGTELAVENLLGFAEKVHNKW